MGSKPKGLAKLRYIAFLVKPYWKHSKSYVFLMLISALCLQPTTTYLTTLLPQKAIDTVMTGKSGMDTLLIVGLYTAGIVFALFTKKFLELAFFQPEGTRISNLIKNDVNERALFTDYKYYYPA
jgi:ABC-type multidrug transport system fused ATPase/permease subunit